MSTIDKHMEQLLHAFARRVKDRRKELSITQERLAEEAGLSPNYLARLELGSKTPSLETLLRLANALNMPIGAILEEDEEDRNRDVGYEVESMFSSLDKVDAEFALRQLRFLVAHLKSIRQH